MIAALIIGFVVFFCMVRNGAQRIERDNAAIAAELGDAYNPDAAGHPYRSALVITIVVLLLTFLFAPPLINTLLVLDQLSTHNDTVQRIGDSK